MIPPIKIINDLKVTLELVIAAHPTIVYNHSLTTLILYKRSTVNTLLFSFMQNYIRVLNIKPNTPYNIIKISYNEINLKQHLIKAIAQWI